MKIGNLFWGMQFVARIDYESSANLQFFVCEGESQIRTKQSTLLK